MYNSLVSILKLATADNKLTCAKNSTAKTATTIALIRSHQAAVVPAGLSSSACGAGSDSRPTRCSFCSETPAMAPVMLQPPPSTSNRSSDGYS